MNSDSQLLLHPVRARAETRGAGASTIRELEPAAVSPPRFETLRREARYRHLLVIADTVACSLGVLATAAIGHTTKLTPQSVLIVLLAPLVAKILGLYDRDPARLRKSTLDELPALLQFAALQAFLTLTLA